MSPILQIFARLVSQAAYFNISELPWSAWQGLPLRQSRELLRWRAKRADHDDRQTYRSRHLMPTMQGNSGLEV